MADLESRVVDLEKWRNSQSINSALIKQHQQHMDDRIAAHADHMDKRFNQHAQLVEKQIVAMTDNFKKFNGWFSKFILAVMISVGVGFMQWIIRGGMM